MHTEDILHNEIFTHWSSVARQQVGNALVSACLGLNSPTVAKPNRCTTSCSSPQDESAAHSGQCCRKAKHAARASARLHVRANRPNEAILTQSLPQKARSLQSRSTTSLLCPLNTLRSSECCTAKVPRRRPLRQAPPRGANKRQPQSSSKLLTRRGKVR